MAQDTNTYTFYFMHKSLITYFKSNLLFNGYCPKHLYKNCNKVLYYLLIIGKIYKLLLIDY